MADSEWRNDNRVEEADEERAAGTCRLAGLRASLLTAGLLLAADAAAQTAETTDRNPQAPRRQKPTQADPAADLALRRDSTRSELEALSKTITLSNDRAAELQAGIAELEKTSESLRAAIVEFGEQAQGAGTADRRRRREADRAADEGRCRS